ncbi:MAG: hypothetical protein ACI9T8_000342 [Candidatus Saccharimonadales bacterium]|jgi:hypothetical protein
MNIVTQFFSKSSKSPETRRQEILVDLMRRESAIGRDIFGPVPKNGSREFFCLDKSTWVWNEEWADTNGKHSKKTMYSIRDTDIVKSVNGSHYESISIKEAKNLRMASKLYVDRVGKKLYGQQK